MYLNSLVQTQTVQWPRNICYKGTLTQTSQFSLLFRVLVHSGDLNAGHYYALLRPQKGGPWFKYDDDRVVPATKRDVLEANFGGEATTVQGRAGMRGRFYTNAYMLVYIRQGDEDEILAEVTEEQIPVHLRMFLWCMRSGDFICREPSTERYRGSGSEASRGTRTAFVFTSTCC